MGKRAKSRFAQLSAEQRAQINNEPGEVLVNLGLTSFLGPPENLPHFQKAIKQLEKLLLGWRTKEYWMSAFVLYANSENVQRARNYGTVVSQFKCGFRKFILDRKTIEFALEDLTTEFIADFEQWLVDDTSKRLDADETNLHRVEETNRRYYYSTRRLVAEMAGATDDPSTVPSVTIFRNKAFSDSRGGTVPTKVLSDVEWDELYRKAREKALEIKAQVEQDWKTLEGAVVQRDESRRGRGRYSNRAAALFALKQYYPDGLVPSLASIKEQDEHLGYAVNEYYGYRSITMCFAPSVETIFPFVVLLAIYSQANTGPLRALQLDKIRETSVLGFEKIVFGFVDEEENVDTEKGGGSREQINSSRRILFEWEKARINSTYERSFAVDENDPISPSELYKFVVRWTAEIRPKAGLFSGNLFIFAGQTRKVRGFHNADQNGHDTDSSWKHAFKQFCRDGGLERTNISEIRATGLNRINVLFGGDLVATRAAAGHARGSSTFRTNYEGDAARLAKDERLAEVSGTMERWGDSNGKIHVRGAPDSVDASAATPGWHCYDPFDSPILGEVSGRLCQAFGQCPKCPLGHLDRHSPYSYARCIQLLDEVAAAQDYLSAERWKVFLPVREALKASWLPIFEDDVIEKAKLLNLGPIGRLE